MLQVQADDTTAISPHASCDTTEVQSRWPGHVRPTPAELRGADYDTDGPPVPSSKLIVCAGPRTSSKRLARLLIAAGIGIPLEYFNENSVLALMRRWHIGKDQYLDCLYRRRAANHVFACNLQFDQIAQWGRPADLASLFDNATVIHLTRDDKAAQAASLATSMLTGRWGFEADGTEIKVPEWRLRRAVSKALRMVGTDDQQWARWFSERGITPLALSTDSVNRHDLELVTGLAARLGVPFNRDKAERMLVVDREPYQGDKLLKARVRARIDELTPGATSLHT